VSDYVHDDTFSGMEAEEIPKEILNAIDSFSVESDEEFLGFVLCLKLGDISSQGKNGPP
jgi:hypothetical protein